MPGRPLITLTTDFGHDDPFVGVMKGVILKINPEVRIVDITHGINPQNIREAAFAIGTSYTYFPDNAVHVVVVDPGVGSARRPVIVSANHHYFIGPDNGVFSYVYRFSPEKPAVIRITADHYFLSSKSPTFQGRDVFAPVAAWFTRGVGMSKMGEPVSDYQTIDLPSPRLSAEGKLRGEVVHIDRFGNAITNMTGADIEKLAGAGGAVTKAALKGREIPLRQFYSEAAEGEVSCLINSSGFLEVFLYKGSAAVSVPVSLGDTVEISASR
jgi:S-adenosylmethionine hydrolase